MRTVNIKKMFFYLADLCIKYYVFNNQFRLFYHIILCNYQNYIISIILLSLLLLSRVFTYLVFNRLL